MSGFSSNKGTYKISKVFGFSAAHRLDHLPPDHPCQRLHGHNYTVEVVLKSAGLNEAGFVIDFTELKQLGQYLKETFDHRCLNDIIDFQPSTENLARHIFNWCKAQWNQTLSVKVSESPKTWAMYSEND